MMEKDSRLRIDKELGVIDKIVPKIIPDDSNIVPYQAESGDDIENDYKYQRDNFYNLVEKGSSAIDGILELAKESEHPRTYEVAGNLIKQVAEVTEKLGDLQEKMRKLKEVPSNAPKNVTNALFVGSTKELQTMLKDKLKDESN
ncbi:terminase small subunit [uncultured Mediterranean phage]|nr:terminase small subunit [uncultured Mediterranean phage]